MSPDSATLEKPLIKRPNPESCVILRLLGRRLPYCLRHRASGKLYRYPRWEEARNVLVSAHQKKSHAIPQAGRLP